MPGFEVEVIGTDANVDRRLSAVAEVDIPFYAGPEGRRAERCRRSSRRSPRAATTSSTSARPGPAGVAAAVIARVMELPVVGCYHTELAAYAGLRAADPQLEFDRAARRIAAFYGQCQVVLSPSAASDEVLRGMGIDARADRPLGPRRRHRALLARPARRGAPARRASASSTPGA